MEKVKSLKIRINAKPARERKSSSKMQLLSAPLIR